MNYIRHLAGFFDRVTKDDRLGPLHISMYVSLFQFWNASHFRNPISISRSELMRVSKISAKATYHKCIKELNNYGYLRYEPSFNPIRGSLVYLFNFETGDELVEDGSLTKNETGTEQVDESKRTKIETGRRQVEEPYINNTKHINSKTLYEQPDENTSSDSSRVGPQEKTQVGRLDLRSLSEGGREGQKNTRGGAAISLPESPEEVKVFFAEQKSTAIEAEKFFNHFQSNGWKVGGRSAMKDWQAAARNWILNAPKFMPAKPMKNNVHVPANKNYGEPL